MLFKKGFFPLGGAPVLAVTETPASVEMEMRDAETGKPVKVKLETVTWCLSEAVDKNGKKFKYLIGLDLTKGGRTK